MNALSIWQPHASLLLAGLKPYETRGWRVPAALLGQRIAIHAGKSTSDLEELAEYVHDRRENGAPAEEAFDRYVRAILAAGFQRFNEMPRGCLIGTLVFSACLPAEQIEDHQDFGHFGPGRFGWRASDAKLLPEPVPFRGMQGFFRVPDELLAGAT